MDITALIALLPQPYTQIATAVVTLAAVATAAFPPPANPKTVFGRVYRVLDVAALNIFHGRTAAKAVQAGEVAPVPAVHPAAPVAAPPA